MTCFTPSRIAETAASTLATLVRPHLNPLLFTRRLQHLQHIFSVAKACCPPPWASHNLQITAEINYQSELWLPLDLLRPYFYTVYRQALIYPPVLSSTAFAQGTSWAAIVAGFPPFLQRFENPAALLEQLICDDELRIKFLFWSFMPDRFYGAGSDRYPGQSAAIAEWSQDKLRRGKRLRCLDAASGDGANTYAVAQLLMDQGWLAAMLEIEGWTLDPLEAWAAAHGCFPHDPVREAIFRDNTVDCFEQGFETTIRFCSVDILTASTVVPFDLILCNGLLGGPIIHAREDMAVVVRNLTELLAPGGMLLVADHFHGGWKQKCPQHELRTLFELDGLSIVEAGEGVGGLSRGAGTGP